MSFPSVLGFSVSGMKNRVQGNKPGNLNPRFIVRVTGDLLINTSGKWGKHKRVTVPDDLNNRQEPNLFTKCSNRDRKNVCSGCFCTIAKFRL